MNLLRISMSQTFADTLQEMTKRLVAEFQPEQIYLFGSRAWGKPDENSDVDLLVIVSQSEVKPIERAVRARRCLRGIRMPKDISCRSR
jgi:predicted nucleotidyltransferase